MRIEERKKTMKCSMEGEAHVKVERSEKAVQGHNIRGLVLRNSSS